MQGLIDNLFLSVLVKADLLSYIRFPVEAYIIILKFSLTERCSQSGEDHTNEIKHDIHPE